MLDARYPIRIKGKTYGPDAIQEQFSKVVLAVNIPEYKPIIYLRRRNKKEYLKMVPNNRSGGSSSRAVGHPIWPDSSSGWSLLSRRSGLS